MVVVRVRVVVVGCMPLARLLRLALITLRQCVRALRCVALFLGLNLSILLFFNLDGH